jgi:hypothetical protein
MAKAIKSTEGISYDTKTLIVVLSLFIIYPVGIILMYLWMKWKLWIKLLLSLPIVLIPLTFIGIFMVAVLAIGNPRAQIQKGQCMKACQERIAEQGIKENTCVVECNNISLPTPAVEELQNIE